MLSFGGGGPCAMLVIVALWPVLFGVGVTSSNAAWQENVRPKMYVQLGKYCVCIMKPVIFPLLLRNPTSLAFHYFKKWSRVNKNCGT
jgi:hypothetical protein